MKFALINGIKQEPSPKKSGFCSFCGEKVISKCGNVKVWHWAHKGKLECDPWWEKETQWHRDWKNQFPAHSQERIAYDSNGEKHIADVKTDEGWVLEFQHSFIQPNERNSRNNFYEKLVWIIDGTRRKRDKIQFSKLINENVTISSTPKIHKVYLDDSALLRDWKNCPCLVFFDFGEENLWCLIQQCDSLWGAVTEIPRSLFILMHSKNKDSLDEDFEGFFKSLMTVVANYKAILPKQLNPDYEYSLFPPRYLSYRKRNKRRFKF